MQYNSHISNDISSSNRNTNITDDIEGFSIKVKAFLDKTILREDLQ